MPADFMSAEHLTEFETGYFQKLGLLGPEGIDCARAERAFARACALRDFEIEMYWKRATYFWGFQAAFMATIAVLLTGGVKDSWAPLYGSAIALSAFIISSRWDTMTRGAKFWQNNWERHVDLLEPYFTGTLYRLYPARRKLPKPPSVSRANLSVIRVLELLWLLTYFVLGFAASRHDPIYGLQLSWVFVFCALGLGLMAACLIVHLLSVLAGSDLYSDQETATFEKPAQTFASGAVLHLRPKID
jgi:hypothetical protein